MKIAIASGKGGTGKTTVAVNLALTLLAQGETVTLLDADVEAPNAHLFLKTVVAEEETVGISTPVIDADRCTACGECARFCTYRAIAAIKGRPLLFPELCHGCGGCAKVCPVGAITERERRIGVVQSGRAFQPGSGQADGMAWSQGRLDVGQPMSPPLIRAVKRRAGHDGVTLVDCPPGTSCPVIAALRGCDRVILVTEPTPFGLNDLRLAVAAVRALDIPFGVVINRADTGNGATETFCRTESIAVLGRIPDDRRIAEAYSRGMAIVAAMPQYQTLMAEIWGKTGGRP
jgi:MinD superfamily P-loop ATPase